MKISLVFAIFLFLPLFTHAQVVINELAWMGTPADGVDSRQEWRHEWIELFNTSDQAVSLNGWRIELYGGETLEFTIVLYKSVEANGYFLVGASDRIPGVDVNYASLAGKLKNSGQRVVLRDTVGNVVEEIDASNGWFAGDANSKLSMERRFAGRSAANAENWGSSQNTGGTPKAQNSLFGKEKFRRLEGGENLAQIKTDPARAPFFRVVGDAIFLRAFLAAFVFAVLLVWLRRYLAVPSEDSSGAPTD